MLTSSNYIYTSKGIYTIDEYIAAFNNEVAPNIITFNEDLLEYEFISIDEIEEIDDKIIFEATFVDLYSTRNVTINLADCAEILQYNILHTNLNPIINKTYQVIRYLESNKNEPRIHIQWKEIKSLLNYSNKCPNITLGDTLSKFVHRDLINSSKVYSFKKLGVKIPIFASLSKTTHSNFILIR